MTTHRLLDDTDRWLADPYKPVSIQTLASNLVPAVCRLSVTVMTDRPHLVQARIAVRSMAPGVPIEERETKMFNINRDDLDFDALAVDIARALESDPDFWRLVSHGD